MTSTERFGYEWERYAAMDPNYEGQFRGWMHPLTPDDLIGKNVLDAGCGMGRNSYWMSRWGAAAVTAFDADIRSVRSTQHTLRDIPNSHISLHDIYAIPWKEEFDIVVSIGVIHHLIDPHAALAKLTHALKPGGLLHVWVYSKEGNEWILRFVDPIRRYGTSRLPIACTHALAYACSIPLWCFIKIVRGPNRYLSQLSRFSFRHIHSIVFDQLIPRVANYWSRDEVQSLVQDLPLERIKVLRPPNEMGWILQAYKRRDL
jgi:SAM-dependent methyltransferase